MAWTIWTIKCLANMRLMTSCVDGFVGTHVPHDGWWGCEQEGVRCRSLDAFFSIPKKASSDRQLLLAFVVCKKSQGQCDAASGKREEAKGVSVETRTKCSCFEHHAGYFWLSGATFWALDLANMSEKVQLTVVWDWTCHFRFLQVRVYVCGWVKG